MFNYTEEVIYMGYDNNWCGELPVLLITHKDGTMDLHRQPSDQFHEHVEKAREILRKRGLRVLGNRETWVSGNYVQVVKID